jgi:alanine racemase
MKECSSATTNTACRDLALERNGVLFEEAQALNKAAYRVLEGTSLDAEMFTHYQALRKKADLKFFDAIEHLRLVNDELPPLPMSANNSENLRIQLQN